MIITYAYRGGPLDGACEVGGLDGPVEPDDAIRADIINAGAQVMAGPPGYGSYELESVVAGVVVYRYVHNAPEESTAWRFAV